MPKIVDHKERKSQILTSAQEVFAREGYHQSRMSMIADLAGVSRTTIYQYYEDKEEIFRHTLRFVFDRKNEEYERILEEEELPVLDKLKKLADKILMDCHEEKSIFYLVVDYIMQLKRQKSEYADVILTRVRIIQSHFDRLLAQALENGEVKDMNPSAVGVILFSMVEAFVIQNSLFEENTLEENKKAVRLLIDGLCH